MRNVSQCVWFCIIYPWKGAAFPDLLLFLVFLFFLNDSGNCISSLGIHVFLSHPGKIQPSLTLSQLNHVSGLSSYELSMAQPHQICSGSQQTTTKLTSLSHPFTHHFPLLWISQSSLSLRQNNFISSLSESFMTFLQSILCRIHRWLSCSVVCCPIPSRRGSGFWISSSQLGSALEMCEEGWCTEPNLCLLDPGLPPNWVVHLRCATFLNSESLGEDTHLLFSSACCESE